MNKITINFIDIFDFFIENVQTETKQKLTFDQMIMFRETNKIIKEISDKIQPFVEINYYYGLIMVKHLESNWEIESFKNKFDQEIFSHFKIISLKVHIPPYPRLDYIDSFIDFMSNNPNLIHINKINFRSTFYNFKEFKNFLEVLGRYKYLVHLNLEEMGIGSEEIDILTCVLRLQCHVLSHLYLRDNEIRSIGAEILAEVLPLMTSLRHLDIASNHIHTDGLENFARMFSQCTTLTSLDISDNNHNPNYRGFVSFIGMLPWSASLVNIDLSENGIENLGEILSQCTSLKTLNVALNYISVEELSNIEKMFRHCNIYK